MRPIHKFILHVVHNWKNELNEAYSEKDNHRGSTRTTSNNRRCIM